ncbi:hypothetical protein LINGRAHAP2_LOCUS6540 [Linum grandiflorum]
MLLQSWSFRSCFPVLGTFSLLTVTAKPIVYRIFLLVSVTLLILVYISFRRRFRVCPSGCDIILSGSVCLVRS